MNNELYHYGIPGMKWGRRRLRGHAGPGVHIGSKKRRLEKHKADLDALNKGEHLSFGITKKRQEMYDRRDKAAIEKKINKLEDAINYSKMSKSEKKEFKSYMKKMNKHGNPDSIADKKSGGQSTKLYNEIKAKKGKEYADSVIKSLGKKYTRDVAISTIVAGAALAATIIPHIRAIRQDSNDRKYAEWLRKTRPLDVPSYWFD